MQRDEFTCMDCGTQTETLHVHHCLYVSGKDPWDYDESLLRTLCHECHESRHDMERDLKLEFARMIAGVDQQIMHRLFYECLSVMSVGAIPFIVADHELDSSAPALREWAENYKNREP